MASIPSVHSLNEIKPAFERTQRSSFFTKADLRQMEALEITPAHVFDQIETYRKSDHHVHLVSPCTPRESVRQLSRAEIRRALEQHQRAARHGRFAQFVPASGAATRMFQSLLQMRSLDREPAPETLLSGAQQEKGPAADLVRFLGNLDRFPFTRDLEAVLADAGLDLHTLQNEGRFRTILDYLLSEAGLHYGALPKGLLKFHRYPEGSRTAFEEHLCEAARYVPGSSGRCSLHLTVSPRYEDRFAALLERILPFCEQCCGIRFEVGFSHQKPCTNTIAVDLENLPFREPGGSLHFRPGGHGALLDNLNALGGDLVYIRNIDNLPSERLKEKVAHWKRVLGGILVELQEAVFSTIRRLKMEASAPLIDAASQFAVRELCLRLPVSFDLWRADRKRRWLLEKLDRPIRVCGMVPNQGQPGGAPFWVEKDGESSIQIVEEAQVDFRRAEQHALWRCSTHFNPVDIVCGVRNYEGKPFDLSRYVDRDTVFISQKSCDGKPLKALELPGLWNGSMADWITVLVEVPAETFNPVKTVFDLLKPEHQP